MFFPILDALFVVPTSEVYLRKELGVGAYRLSAWYLARSTISYAPYFIWPPLHVTITYWVTAANDEFAAFVAVMACIWLFILEFQSFSLLLSAAVPPGRVMTVALLFLTFMFLFTGVFVPLDETPLPWLGFVNPVLYALQTVAAILFLVGDKHYSCNILPEPSAFPEFCSGNGPGAIPPEAALARYGVTTPAWLGVVVSAGFALVFRVLAYFFLRRRMRDPKPRAARSWCLGRAKDNPASEEASATPATGVDLAPTSTGAEEDGANALTPRLRDSDETEPETDGAQWTKV